MPTYQDLTRVVNERFRNYNLWSHRLVQGALAVLNAYKIALELQSETFKDHMTNEEISYVNLEPIDAESTVAPVLRGNTITSSGTIKYMLTVYLEPSPNAYPKQKVGCVVESCLDNGQCRWRISGDSTCSEWIHSPEELAGKALLLLEEFVGFNPMEYKPLEDSEWVPRDAKKFGFRVS